jgi:hypothetical protein
MTGISAATRLRRLIRLLRGRIAARIAVITVLAGTVVVIAAAPAGATLFGKNCNPPPAPQIPGSGWPGRIIGKPSPLPSPGDPFAPHSATSEYDQYGYAGLQWSTYGSNQDLAVTCIPAVGFNSIDTWIGNKLLGAASVVMAVDSAVHDWSVNSQWLATLNPVVSASSRVMYRTLFAVWGGVALMVLGITVAGRAGRGDLHEAATKALWAVFVLGLVGVTYVYPLAPGRYVAQAMSATIGEMDAGFVGQSPKTAQQTLQAHDSLLVKAVLYPCWLEGEFGTYNAAASTYGPQLLTNQALTWREAAASPQQIAATVKAEQHRWAQVAAKVKANDPAAYSYLQGNAGSRVSAGTQALVESVIVAGFDIICSLVVLVAMMAVLLAVIFLPGLAVVGIHHDARHLIVGLFSRIAGRVISAFLWAAAAGVDARASQALLTHNVDPILTFFALLFLPIALYVLVRRVRGNHVIPRPVMAAAGYLGARRLLRRGTAAGVRDALGDTYNTVNFFPIADGWGGPPGGGWYAEPTPPGPRGPVGPLGGGGSPLPPGDPPALHPPPAPDSDPPTGPPGGSGGGGGAAPVRRGPAGGSGGSGGAAAGRPRWPDAPGGRPQPMSPPRPYTGAATSSAGQSAPVLTMQRNGTGSYVYDGGADANRVDTAGPAASSGGAAT